MPQKKILLIIVLLFVGIAWFVLDTDKNETTMAVQGKTYYIPTWITVFYRL